MKFKFSREVKYTPNWNGNAALPDGERLTAVLKPMKVGDLLLVMDAMGRKPGVVIPEGEEPQVDITRFITEAGGLLPKYVSIEGLEDESGPVKMTDLLEYGAYLPLAAELLMECAKISMPSETTEGNLNGLSGSPATA